jgi:putative transposase
LDSAPGPNHARLPRQKTAPRPERFAEKVLDRDFLASAAKTKWVADTILIETSEGWLYLAAALDFFSRRVGGWAMGGVENTELVLLAMRMALSRRTPHSACLPLLHHSDRGSEYSSQEDLSCSAKEGMTISMSRTRECYENAAMESFFATLKKECISRRKSQTRREARLTIFEDLECFYNTVRLHSLLQYQSPRSFEETQWQNRSSTFISPFSGVRSTNTTTMFLCAVVAPGAIDPQIFHLEAFWFSPFHSGTHSLVLIP